MPQPAKLLDLITVGRSSVDLYGQQIGGRLEDTSSFAKFLGGSPTNTAAGAVRLGLRAGLLTDDEPELRGCINRLQKSIGAEPFNNLLAPDVPRIDFAAHAASLGAWARKVASLSELEAALEQARAADRTSVIVIDTDPDSTTSAGGAWWDVAVPEVSNSKAVVQARTAYEDKIMKHRRED